MKLTFSDYHDYMSLLFWRRANRTNTDSGKAPISIRITIPGFPRAEFLTGIEATAAEWNTAKHRLQVTRGMGKAEKQLLDESNEVLADLELAFRKAYKMYRSAGANPSPAELRELLRRPRALDYSREYVVNVGAAYLADMTNPRRNYSPKTLSNVRQQLDVLTAYLREIKRPQLRGGEVDAEWMRKYDRWCEGRGWSYGTTSHLLGTLVALLKFGAAEGLCKINSETLSYKRVGQPSTPEKRALTEQELAALQVVDLPEKKLSDARAIFIFSCYTGLSYVDYARFAQAPDQYLKSVPHPKQPGRLIRGIEMVRSKVSRKPGAEATWFPLFENEPPLAYLFSIYKQGLPLQALRAVNKHLKVVVAHLLRAGVPFHLVDLCQSDARSTYSQRMMDQYGRELTAAGARHTEEVSAKHYSRLTPARIIEQIEVLGGKLAHN